MDARAIQANLLCSLFCFVFGLLCIIIFNNCMIYFIIVSYIPIYFGHIECVYCNDECYVSEKHTLKTLYICMLLNFV